MSVKSLSVAEWCNTMLIEPVAHWWKLLHLQYYDPGVGGDFPEKITNSAQLGFWHNRLALQLTCVWSGVLFFFVSAGVVSKRLLWPDKQRKGRWLQTMKLETETKVRSKNTPAITAYRHRCRERQRNENLRDYNFKVPKALLLLKAPVHCVITTILEVFCMSHCVTCQMVLCHQLASSIAAAVMFWKCSKTVNTLELAH